MALVVYKPGFLEQFHKQERRFVFKGKEIIIKQDWAKHGVAAVVWDAAVVLSEYLDRKVKCGELKLDGSRVLELGAGTGLVGMVAALLGAKVILTDRVEVIDSLNCNVHTNFKDDRSTISVRELEWGKHLDDYSENYDFILGADIVYIKESFPALLDTLTHLSKRNTKVLLSCRIRYQKDLDFIEMIKKTFSVTEGATVWWSFGRKIAKIIGPALCRSKMTYPFLDDSNTIKFISDSNVMIFLSGFGHGNEPSSLSGKLTERYPTSSRVLPFSSEVSKSVDKAIKDNIRTIIIDNASDDVESMQPYYTVAQENLYIEMAIKAYGQEAYQAVGPTFFGWFLNLGDSVKVRECGMSVLQDSFDVKEFAEDFREHCEHPTTKDLTKYFSTKELDVGSTMLHCTSMYQNQVGFEEYSKSVAQHIGQVVPIEVLGFLITPRTFGARLKLGNYALELWDSTDTQDTKEWTPSEFSPTNGRGSRAHLTLETGPGVEAVQTGLDLIELVKLEVESQKDRKRQKFNILDGNAILRRYGKGQAMVYLKDPMSLSFFMSGFNLKT